MTQTKFSNINLAEFNLAEFNLAEFNQFIHGNHFARTLLRLVPWVLFVLAVSVVQQNPAQARLLEGALQQSESLPALSDQFKVGATFSDDMLGRADSLDEWVMIPPSMAGTWARNGTTLLSVRMEPSGEWLYPNTRSFPQGSYIRGFQVDGNGNIWDCPRARRQRFETTDEGRTRMYIIITGRRQMLVTGPFSIHDYGEATCVDVDVASGAIKRVERTEQVIERKVVADGVIIAECSKRNFSPAGKLIASYTDRSEERRTASFSPLDTLNGMDLKTSFQNFLRSSGNFAPPAPR